MNFGVIAKLQGLGVNYLQGIDTHHHISKVRGHVAKSLHHVGGYITVSYG